MSEENLSGAEIGAIVRELATIAMDEDEVKRSVAECTAKGGPENCPYHRQFVHAEGAGLHSYYNKKKVVEVKGKRVYIDTGAKENAKHLSDREKKDGVRSDPTFGTKIYKDGKAHRNPKGMKAVAIKLPEQKENKEGTPNLDSFNGVAEVKVARLNDFSDDELYVRSHDPIAGVEIKRNERLKKDERVAKKGEEGKPMYRWTKGGKEVEPSEALRLEGALRELKMGAALAADSYDVKIRPDISNGFGQIATYKDGKGNVQYGYSQSFKDACAVKKYERLTNLLDHYDDIIHNIMADCQKGKKEAIISYFMYRTKCRVGSKSNPDANEGRGATALQTGHFSVDGDTVRCSFPAKNGYWHVSVEDKFLANFVRKRKNELATKEGGRSEKFFDVSYGKVNAYLKDISMDYVGGDEKMAFRPHNFRHFAATRIALQSMEKYAKGVDPAKEPDKYETAVCKAVTDAATVLNDTPDVVFHSYIIPQIVFGGNPKLMYREFPFLKQNRDLGGLGEIDDGDDD